MGTLRLYTKQALSISEQKVTGRTAQKGAMPEAQRRYQNINNTMKPQKMKCKIATYKQEYNNKGKPNNLYSPRHCLRL